MAAYSTITEQISEGKSLKVSNARLNVQKVLATNGDKMVINFQSLLTNYWYQLQKRITSIRFTDKQYRRYRFRPKTLSNDLYGTIEIAPLLLQINGLVSTSEFDLKICKVFDTSIKDFFIEVMNKEKKHMTDNSAEVTDDLKASTTTIAT